MTKHLLCAIAVIALLLTGCNATSAGQARSTAPTKTVRTKDVPINFIPADVTADLDVGGQKIMGKATRQKGLSNSSLKEAAIQNALRTVAGQDLRNMPDVLVEPRFIIERDKLGTITEVTVVGYPARFRNFRNVELEK